MAASGRPTGSACLAKTVDARASCRLWSEVAPPPLFLSVHRTLISLQPQDEFALPTKKHFATCPPVAFCVCFVYRSDPAASGSTRTNRRAVRSATRFSRWRDGSITLRYTVGYSAPAIGICQRAQRYWHNILFKHPAVSGGFLFNQPPGPRDGGLK